MSSNSFGRTASPKLGPRTELEGIDWHDLASDGQMDEVTDLGERGTAPRISPGRLLRDIVQHLTIGRKAAYSPNLRPPWRGSKVRVNIKDF